jgi:hypothetical protein
VCPAERVEILPIAGVLADRELSDEGPVLVHDVAEGGVLSVLEAVNMSCCSVPSIQT